MNLFVCLKRSVVVGRAERVTTCPKSVRAQLLDVPRKLIWKVLSPYVEAEMHCTCCLLEVQDQRMGHHPEYKKQSVTVHAIWHALGEGGYTKTHHS